MDSTLKTARVKSGLSLDALARLTGLTVRTIHRVENGDSWSRGSVSLIARELGVPFEAVISEYEASDGPSSAKTRAAATTTGG